MIIKKKLKINFLLICLLINIIFVEPSFALDSRESFFKKALDLSSSGNFNFALKDSKTNSLINSKYEMDW